MVVPPSSFSSSRGEVALCSGFIDSKSPAAGLGREGGGLRLEQVSTWTLLRVLDFQCTRNPREEALLLPLDGESFLGVWWSCWGPKHPKPLFHRSQGGGERAEETSLLLAPVQGECSCILGMEWSVGTGSVSVMFFGEAT